ncbi:hypothetical protein BJX68DRAFT_260699 [Aspergillus pseudodeflectus]|uniref:Uncharacterized protein n=1 Tax=Aspergillus pseudodeflectus TaxID=176178 RepID=A0ABR4LCN9_9EURO
MQYDQEKKTGSRVFNFCGLKRRLKKGEDINPVGRDFLSYYGIKWRRGNSKVWRIDTNNDGYTLPDYLDAMLLDYTLAMTPTDIDVAPVSVGMVLQLLLAEARQKMRINSPAQFEALCQLRGPFWSYNQVISLADTEGAQGDILDCALSCALWYGDPRYLETNCVVIQAEQPIISTNVECEGGLPVLGAMSMIQRNRRINRRANRDVYGIFTDGFIWMFHHVDKKHKYSSCVLNWNEGQRNVIEATQSSEVRSVWNRPQASLSEGRESMSHTADGEDVSSQSPNTEWFSKLERSVMQIFARRGDPKETLMVEEAFRVARSESQKPQLPKKAVTDMASEDLYDTFDLIQETGPTQVWDLAASELKGITKHLSHILTFWDKMLLYVEPSEMISAQLNIIMVSILAAKRREAYRLGTIETLASYKSLRWGSRANVETNLVVVQAKEFYHASSCVPQAITYMAILYHARKQAGRFNSPIYGLATDSWNWYFLRLDPDGVVSKHMVDWHTDPVEVVSHIHKIMDHAACLASMCSRTLT